MRVVFFPLDICFYPTLTCPKAYTFPLPSGPISWDLPQAGDFVLFTMIYHTYLSYQSIRKPATSKDRHHLLAVMMFVDPVGRAFAGVILAKG
jgi:hypothetical protein